MIQVCLFCILFFSIGGIIDSIINLCKKNQMKIAIVGSRTFGDYDLLADTLDEFISKNGKPDKIISGGARGADNLAEIYAKEKGIQTEIYPADWNTYGKAAGYIRNSTIIQNCDVCFAFWDGQSRGTAHDIKLCEVFNKPCHIIKF